jgi:DNA-3-methyladenine glycosylase
MGNAKKKDAGAAGPAKAKREEPAEDRIKPVTVLRKLDAAFYDRAGVVAVARDLLGKVLVTEFGGQRTSGRIVETEAYNGVGDRASHAWSGRRTRRTEVMYAAGGAAYVYLIYGIHHLFNVVTNKKDVPHAVLVRALEPMEGIGVMRERFGKGVLRGDRVRKPDGAVKPDYSLTRGPGNLSRALGLRTVHTGVSLMGDEIWIGDDGYRPKRAEIIAGPRIGVDYAGVDAGLPYRFFIKGSSYVSGPKTKG